MKSNADIFEESRYGYNPDDSSRSSDLSQPPRIPLIFPPPALCTDNGVMVAWAGIEKLRMGISNQIDGQEPFARWPLGNVWQEFRQPADE
jgi:tRNA A37 threonylcarbamoyltransferase TsaD